MKYTVVIPTLGLSHRTTKLLAALCLCEKVEKIILIHNTVTELSKITFDKIIHVSFHKNSFVNKSWNIGVLLAETEFVALCNDDINFDPDIAFSVNVGDCIVGQSWDNYQLKKQEQKFCRTSVIDTRPHGWGCLLLFRKELYKPIPEDLLIACGDDWLFQEMQPAQMSDLMVETEMSTSCSTGDFYLQCEKDIELFKTKYKQNGTR